ncbi:MAG: UbiA family prenyltransferase [Bacteroidetes bacterium]|nr:UbiA family prenyltransferase [Bacteroidota bacterium]
MLKLFRTNTWWNAVVPQVLGWMYMCFLYPEMRHVKEHWFLVLGFFVSLICISVFGYLFNDLCDVESDAKAGKRNVLGELTLPVRLLLVVIPLAVGIVSWVLIERGIGSIFLFAMQILALVLYSMPPFRLKNRGLVGVVVDAFYGHVNPVLITLLAFGFWYTEDNAIVFFCVIAICTSLKGIRNILLHQLDDRSNDKRAGTQTFVVRNGAYPTLLFINNLLPFEVFFTLALALFMGYYNPPFFVWTLLFFIITYFKFSGWKLRDLPKRQLKFKFLYFLNDYYEGWVPVFFLIILCISQPQLSFLLILHLILFPGFVTKLWGDIKTIRENFKTEDDY